MSTVIKRKRAETSSRLSREDWIAAATVMLQEQSIDSVRVEVLATELGVTKGSFYSHFKSRAELLTAVLRGWERKATWSVIDRLESSGKSPVEKMATLFEVSTRRIPDRPGGPLDLAIRGWSGKDRSVREAVESVDEARRGYVAGLFRQMGHDPNEAQAFALLYYAYVTGRNLLQHSSASKTTEHKYAAAERMLLRQEIDLPRVSRWLATAPQAVAEAHAQAAALKSAKPQRRAAPRAKAALKL